MKKIIKIAFYLIFSSNYLYGQIDSTESRILNYENSRSGLISKNRRLLLDTFIEGDIQTVKKIKDLLIKNEDDTYYALYPPEYWLILYWTTDYTELAEHIQKFDSARAVSYRTRIGPLHDMLYVKLEEKSFDNEVQLKNQIQLSPLDSETKQALNMTLDWLLLKKRENIYAQDFLNERVDSFLEIHPQSKFKDFAKTYIRYEQVLGKWGMAVEFFSGYSAYTGNLRSSYTNNVPLGVAFDICYNSFELYLRDYIGFNKTKKDFDYSAGTWDKGSRAMVFLPEASLGYVAYNSDRFKLSPFAGIGAMDIGPPTHDTQEIPELKEVALAFTTAYIAGVNLDIKFGPRNMPKYSPKTSYGFLRIRYGYSFLGFDKKYENMTGDMHYITIGLGGMGRASKRAY